jgi:hypothetical protein
MFMKKIIVLLYSLISASCILIAQEAPSIGNHPASGNKCFGSDIIFSVSATGDEPISYQWYKDGGILVGEESQELSLTNLSTTENGIYKCVVTNPFGTAESNDAQLIVSDDIPAEMTVSTQFVSMCEGSNNSLSVAGGELGVDYTWYRDGVIAGYTPFYSIANASSEDDGEYWCYAQNACGDRYSDTVSIDYINSPQITVSPTNQTVCEGEDATFTAEASGDYLNYMWLKNGVMISGEFSTSLTIESLSFPSPGDQYEFIAYNVCAEHSDTSNSVYIFVNNMPQITGHPISNSACVGEEISLYATATSSTPVSYQWYDSEDILIDENSVQLTISIAEEDNYYYCEISNVCGTLNTDTAWISPVIPISFTQQASDATVCAGENVNLLVKVAGTEPFYYQWLHNDVNVYGDNISGENTDELVITEITSGQNGIYTCFVWNACGSLTSNPANVVVNTMPELYTQPASEELCAGEELEIDFIYNGSEPISFEWYIIPESEPVSTESVFYSESADNELAGDYYCILSNTCGIISTDTININVLMLPEITSQPESADICAGNPMLLSVESEGSEPMSYMWYRNGFALTSEVSAELYYEESSIANTGEYFCMIYNACATIYSDTVFVNVGTAPIITWNPINKNLCELDSLILLMSAAGDNFMVQWFHNDNPIPGANDTALIISSVNTTNQGDYYAKAYNACETVYTDTVYVQVSPAPALELGDDIHTCEGEIITLIPTGDYVHYNWNNGLSNQASLEVALSGTFILEVTGPNSCKNRDTILVEFHPYHEIVFNPEPTVSCGPLMLDAGEGAYSYQWSTGEEDVHFITVNEDGSYSVTATGDWFGCESSASTNIEIREPIEISLGPDVSAPVNSYVNIGIEAQYAEYLWNTGFTGASLSVFGSEYGEGLHEFWITAWAVNGCHDTDTIMVTFTPASNIDDYSNQQQTLIYPVPASDYIIIENLLANIELIEIVNINGQTVLSHHTNYTDKLKIDVSNLANGIYFVKTHNKSSAFSISKIIIQK